MFEQAILKVQEFTRPLLTIQRNFTDKITPGAATIFFVNEQGVAITCKHVAEVLRMAEVKNQKFSAYLSEKNAIVSNLNLENLAQKYSYSSNSVTQMKCTFQNCFDQITGFDVIAHGSLDLAIIKFKGFAQTLYNSYATFVDENTTINTGKFLCRLGYPFPEFTNYKIDNTTNDLQWTQAGVQNTPAFPLEGMITRFVAEQGTVAGIELSTPGLRGQSGGPLFDSSGVVFGMQSLTLHLHLGFDIQNMEVSTDSGIQSISNHPFLHVGRCVHAQQITKFLRENGIKYHTQSANTV